MRCCTTTVTAPLGAAAAAPRAAAASARWCGWLPRAATRAVELPWCLWRVFLLVFLLCLACQQFSFQCPGLPQTWQT